MWLGQEGELEQEGGAFSLYLLPVSLYGILLKHGGKNLKFVSCYGVLIQHIIM